MPTEADQIIWRNFSIGEPDARADRGLLDACFVDAGCLSIVRSTDSHASVILGRTGQGKSAIILRLQSIEPNVIEIKPLELAFKFVENSTVLTFFEEAGVNLNLFYRLLWRHVLVTELIRYKYNLRDKGSLSKWFDTFLEKIRSDSPRARALSYLKKWGESFWEETEVRLTEVTRSIESELSASLEGTVLAAKMGSISGEKLTDSERAEVVSRGSSVVNRIQIADLNRLISLLSEEVFDDPKQRFYIAIDSLDEDWASSKSKYQLIRSLIEEVRSFRADIRNVKIIVALRQDLLEKVYEETRGGGFQEEKYETYYARIDWQKEELLELLNLRINEAFKRKYTSKAIGLMDIFPKPRNGIAALDYVLERTMARPRDVIAFANECFSVAAGRTRISWQAIRDAELPYSRKRRNALIDEWVGTWPSVALALDLLRGFPESFSRSQINSDVVETIAVSLATLDSEDELIKLCKKLVEPKSTVTDAQVLSCIIQVLYHVGAIGVKFSPQSPFIWSFRDQRTVSSGEAKRTVNIKIHKMLWRALEVTGGDAYKFPRVDP